MTDWVCIGPRLAVNVTMSGQAVKRISPLGAPPWKTAVSGNALCRAVLGAPLALP